MKYCSHCGSELNVRIPEGDNLPRHICDSCGTIHYQNPKIVTGCIPIWQDKILLCKRAIQPRLGLWTLPAGFMENNETVSEAALRETWEEAKAEVEILALYGLYNIPRISQVYTIFRAQLLNLNFAPGIESLEVKLFAEEQIPWQELAFPVVEHTLTQFFSDRKNNNQFPFHIDDIHKRAKD